MRSILQAERGAPAPLRAVARAVARPAGGATVTGVAVLAPAARRLEATERAVTLSATRVARRGRTRAPRPGPLARARARRRPRARSRHALERGLAPPARGLPRARSTRRARGARIDRRRAHAPRPARPTGLARRPRGASCDATARGAAPAAARLRDAPPAGRDGRARRPRIHRDVHGCGDVRRRRRDARVFGRRRAAVEHCARVGRGSGVGVETDLRLAPRVEVTRVGRVEGLHRGDIRGVGRERVVVHVPFGAGRGHERREPDSEPPDSSRHHGRHHRASGCFSQGFRASVGPSAALWTRSLSR